MVARLRADGYDVPVLEATQYALTLLDLHAKMELYQSRETYMEPPKKDKSKHKKKSVPMRNGTSFLLGNLVPVLALICLFHFISLEFQIRIANADTGVRRD